MYYMMLLGAFCKLDGIWGCLKGSWGVLVVFKYPDSLHIPKTILEKLSRLRFAVPY